MQPPEDGGVERLPPVEDVGSDTLGRYRYQAELATRPCLSLLVRDDVERVICEWHEDYVVCFSSGVTALVSVKHLEESQPRWTVATLCTDGGLAHLFGRWRAARERATCLLQTNTKMRTGADQPAALRDCCAAQQDACLEEWSKILLPHLAKVFDDGHKPTVEEVLRFLRMLRVEDDLPKRSDIRSRNLTDLMPDVMSYLGRSAAHTELVYDAVVAEVERASRNEGGREVLELIGDPTRFDVDAAMADVVQAKTLDRSRILQCLAGDSVSVARSTVRMLSDTAPPSRLVAKLANGGFGPTALNNARNLRLNWEAHMRRWSSDLPTLRDEFDDVMVSVLHAAQAAEGRSRVATSAYGPRMLEELEAELQARAIIPPGLVSPEVRLTLGCAFALTDECRIWWSDEFEIGAAP
jgi:hypothetical protein